MKDATSELFELLAEVGATPTLYGKPCTESEVRAVAEARIDELLATIRKLPVIATEVRMHSRDLDRLKQALPQSAKRSFADLAIHCDDTIPEGDPRLVYSDGSVKRLRKAGV